MRLSCLAGILVVGLASVANAQNGTTSNLAWNDPILSLHVPQNILRLFKNPDGSCVQCSNSMTGTDQNIPQFSYLLWNSPYGGSVRGGSNPSRVASYAKARNVRIWNITGEQTFDWMKWACRNGRGAAIGAGTNHFQTLVGYDPQRSVWFVVNNNGDQRIQEYGDKEFHQLHYASGPWCVILDYPPAAAPPEEVNWWESAKPAKPLSPDEDEDEEDSDTELRARRKFKRCDHCGHEYPTREFRRPDGSYSKYCRHCRRQS